MTVLLLACVEPQYIDPRRDPPEESTEGWVLGEPAACEAPVEPAWTDESERFEVFEGILAVEASLALAQVEGAWLVAVPNGGGLATWPLEGGAWTLSDEDDFPVRGVAVEVVEGRTDLVLTGQANTWRRGWTLEGESDQSLDLHNRGTVEAFDLDGDGAVDLNVAAPGTGEILQYTADGDLEVHPTDQSGAVFDVLAHDFDGDGAPDLYVCNDFGPEHGGNLWLRNDGAGGLETGDDNGSEIVSYCMGASLGDLDGDGLLDLYLTAIEEHHVLLGSAAGFVDATAAMGMPGFEDAQMGWGAHITDLDNDGHVDLLVAQSDFSDPEAELFPLWWLDSQAGWADRGAEIGLPQDSRSRAVVARDLNGDGLLDVLASDFSGNPLLFESAGCTADSWLRFSGPHGSVVTVEAGERSWVGLISGSPGSLVSMPPEWHLGLGSRDAVDRITLRAPWHEEAVLVGPIEVNQEISWSPP